jgi:hypothetical protein
LIVVGWAISAVNDRRLAMKVGSRLRDRHREKEPITVVLDQSSRLPGIVGSAVPARIVEWLAEQLVPLARLINGHVGQV